MHISIITLFPEYFSGPLNCGLMQRARDTNIITFSFHNPRDFGVGKHKNVDDRPYGGGPGMVLMAEPLESTFNSLGITKNSQLKNLIYLSPKGKTLTQKMAQKLSSEQNLTLICGRYEGIDARIEECYPINHISIGDFILNGGEAAALGLIESVARLLPGFMGHEKSGESESFNSDLLEYPHYTRPETIFDEQVPSVLLSGNHAAIETWRREAMLDTTLANRPDLLAKAPLTPEDRQYLRQKIRLRPGKNLYCALVHYPVLDKSKKTTTVSLTNLDIHDISRSSCTYGLGAYYIVTPIKDQQDLFEEIVGHWTKGSGKISNPDRNTALSCVHGKLSIADVIEDIELKTGEKPLIAGTTALVRPTMKKKGKNLPPEASFQKIGEELENRPVLLLFGTGHGLAPQAVDMCDVFLPPVRWLGEYNHLSVRAAAAIIMDRILGDWL